MITKENFKEVLECLDFTQKDNIFTKYYKEFDCELKADLKNKKLIYPKELKVHDKTTSNFSSPENFVVFECVYRLLNQGYNPKHIELEPKWQVGHGASGGKADILIRDNRGKSLLIIECKTAGGEFKKAWDTTKIKPTQLFSYAQQDRDTKFIALYTSDFVDREVKYKYYLISLSDDKKIIFENKNLKSYREAQKIEDIYSVWSETYKKEFRTNGIFEKNKAYFIGVEKTNVNDLKIVSSNDIKGKYNEFATIMRQHNIGGAERAFNVLVNLFLSKIIDENENMRNDKSELKFYWKGIAYDDAFSLQDRLQELYKIGMDEFLDEEITYISDKNIENIFKKIDLNSLKEDVKEMFRKQKFFTNNDFSFLDVHSEELFYKNFEVLLKVVKMFQDIRVTGVEDNQFLGDMFEGFLDQGVKQSEGQFFTPMPIVKFIINSLPLDSVKKRDKKPKAIDFACGAGHFLNEVAKIFKTDEVIGVEKEYRLSKIAKVSALMYGQKNINIVYSDALIQNEKVKDNSFSVLVANPPYSVKGFLETLSKNDLEAYELTKTVDEKSYTANNTIECFFIERAKQLLVDGGITGIILPSSILNKGDGKNTYVATREILLKYFDIIAIVEFGSGTFGKTGTNTVTLFLQRRDDTENIVGKYQDFVDNLFINNKNIENLFEDKQMLENYCAYINVDFKIYYSIFEDRLNQDIFKYETFAEYKAQFEKLTETKNRKKRKSYKDLSPEEKEISEEKELVKYIKLIERDKLYYFCLANSNSSDVVIVKSPSKTSENKKFLGYEWSGRKGNEGIQYIGERLNSINTPLYNPKDSNDNLKINKIIKDNFQGIKREIPEELKEFVSRERLLDMLDFSRVEFNKSISLSPKRKIEIESKYPLEKIENILEKIKGNTTKIPKEEILNNGKYPVITQEVENFISGYTNNSKTITDLPLIVFGDHTCSFKYVDFKFVRGADGTQLLKPNDKFNIKYFYYILQIVNITNKHKYERHMKYLYPIKIPLPPLEIQEKIVQECQRVDDEVLKAEQRIKEAKENIEKEISSVKGEMVKIDKLNNLLRRGKATKYGNSDIQVIKSGQARGYEEFNFKEKYYTIEKFISDERNLQKGDLLINSTGVGTAGRVTLFNLEGNFVADSHITIFRPNKKILSKYALYALANIGFKRIEKMAKGASGQIELSLEIIKNIKIKTPSLQTQKEIVTKIETHEEKIKEAKKVIDSAKEKKEKILKEYLI